MAFDAIAFFFSSILIYRFVKIKCVLGDTSYLNVICFCIFRQIKPRMRFKGIFDDFQHFLSF